MKPIFTLKSKTHWLGMIVGILSGVQIFLPQMVTFIPKEAYGIIFGVVGIAIIVLRNVTTQAIEDK